MQFGRLFALAVTATLMLSPLQATPNKKQTEDDNDVCLPLLHVWNGSPAETAAILTTPVPDSYRNGIQYCGGPLRPVDLLDWHMRFGSEASTLAALDYLERRDAFQNDLIKSVDSYSAELSKELARNPPPAKASAARIKLHKLTQAFEAQVERGMVVMSAAHRFGSLALRDKAWAALRRSELVAMQLDAVRQSPNTNTALAGFLNDNYLQFDKTPLLVATIAIFDAAHSGTLEDKQKVEKLLKVEPLIDSSSTFSEIAMRGDEFCDLADYAPKVLKDACDADQHATEIKVVEWLYTKAQAELLYGNPTSAHDFLWIAERTSDNGIWNTWWRGIDVRVINLRRAIATKVYEDSLSGVPNVEGMADGLAKLIATTQLFNPLDDPVLYRQIANDALAWEQKITELNGDDELHGIYLQSRRKVGLIRAILSKMDSI